MANIDLSAIRRRTGAVTRAVPAPTAPTVPLTIDPVLNTIASLRSGDVEIRFQCARALGKMQKSFPHVRVDEAIVRDAARRGLQTPKALHYEPTLTDIGRPAITKEDVFPAVVPHELEQRALRHLFMVLSLACDTDSLGVPYQGLHTDAPHPRETALEYLEATLPHDVFQGVEGRVAPVDGRGAPGARGAEELSEELKRSHGSILRKLQESQSEPF